MGEGAKRVTTGDDMSAGFLVAWVRGEAAMAVLGADSTGLEDGKGPGRWSLLGEVLAQEAPRLTIWSPVLLVSGIWIYFALAFEPTRLLTGSLAAVAALVFWKVRNRAFVMAFAILLSGVVLAKIRTEMIATPILRAVAFDVAIAGRIADVDRRSPKRLIVTIDLESASNIPPEEMPRRIRLQLTGSSGTPQIGDNITGKAVLTPLPLPVAPGAFDYGRSLYFQSIGALGRFTGSAATDSAGIPLRYQLRRSFHFARSVIGERVRAVIPGPLGSFADALITGERAQIPRAMNESLQASGLYHILSISGLHMAMVVGSTFWVVRALLALSTVLALTRPIKSWAASVALVVGFFYMLLADGGAATERSFIMVAVMLFAVMVNRPAISLHNLAVAAILILVFEPEQAVAASFQMSFLAVMGLAAFFEWWSRKTDQDMHPQQNFAQRWGRKLVLLVAASLMTSLIAGGLSGIAAAHHFGRVAPYGIVANALALPIVSIAVMPMALLSVLLMPFGLEALPLAIMGQGLRAVMVVSDWVAGWPYAGLGLPLLNSETGGALAFAAAFLCLAKSQLRWLALPAMVVAGIAWFGQQRPDILVEERARTVAARGADGLLVPLPGKGSSFAIRKWLEQAGQREKTEIAIKRLLWTCEAAFCSAKAGDTTIAYLRETANPIKPCPAVEILVAQYPLRRSCKGKRLTIDRFDVWRHGAHAIFVSDDLVVETARGMQGARPWVWKPRPRSTQSVKK